MEGQKWFYSEKVKEHFFKPRNFLDDKKAKKYRADGIGIIGSPVCGDVMKVWIKVDKKKERIREMKWQTFGCASAIASTSVLSEMVAEKGGMKIDDAMNMKPQEIIARLHGLPAIKIHCSVLGNDGLKEAIKDYYKKSGRK
jgi:NifU-like protein involved in Fe-S cluster formation